MAQSRLMTKFGDIRLIPLVFLFILAPYVSAQNGLQIKLANSTPAEQQTKTQLERLMQTYDLTKWVATRVVVIDEKTSIPHSHPVLTLNTRHIKDDELLLSTFVHENMHWFVIREDGRIEAAVKEFRTMFPKVPVSGPEGARDENSTYTHIAVCYLEYRALRELMGELKAKQVIEFWATDHYTWIYKTVLERTRDIGNVMFKHNLIPDVVKPSSK
jgi:hypothetical protein